RVDDGLGRFASAGPDRRRTLFNRLLAAVVGRAGGREFVAVDLHAVEVRQLLAAEELLLAAADAAGPLGVGRLDPADAAEEEVAGEGPAVARAARELGEVGRVGAD